MKTIISSRNSGSHQLSSSSIDMNSLSIGRQQRLNASVAPRFWACLKSTILSSRISSSSSAHKSSVGSSLCSSQIQSENVCCRRLPIARRRSIGRLHVIRYTRTRRGLWMTTWSPPLWTCIASINLLPKPPSHRRATSAPSDDPRLAGAPSPPPAAPRQPLCPDSPRRRDRPFGSSPLPQRQVPRSPSNRYQPTGTRPPAHLQ